VVECKPLLHGQVGAIVNGVLERGGRGFHSSNFQINLSTSRVVG